MYNPYDDSLAFRAPVSRILTVAGVGEVAIEPDTVTVQLTVMTEGDQLAIVQQENAVTMTRVIQSLNQLGVPEENIRTVSFNIHPRYDYVDGKQVFRGYEVIHTISVKVTNFSEIGNIIDTAVKNGVNQVGNIAFSRSDFQQVEQQALQLAIANAEAKAHAMAETLHIQLNTIPVKVTELTQEEAPMLMKSFTLSEAATTPIEPGQIVIRASVQVQYEY